MRAALLVFAILFASCASPTASPAAPTVSPTRYGVAGLIPPHFPAASPADYEALYGSFGATGGVVGVYTPWADPGKEGAVPAVVSSTMAAAAKYHFGPLVIALGVTQDAQGGVKSTVDWTGAQRERFLAAVTALARDQKPEYLALGVESNRLWMSDKAAFEGFVKGYAEAYDAIKKASPSTKVFTIFQLELMRGHAYLMTGLHTSPTQWELLAKFQGKLDLVGYTTYPYLSYYSPGDLPEDYYVEAASHASRLPIAFTEIGWPSGEIGGAAAAGTPYGGTPEEQAAFVTKFFALTAAVHPVLALWSLPNDLGAGAPTTFTSVSLRRNDGTPKPALAAWQKGVGTK